MFIRLINFFSAESCRGEMPEPGCRSEKVNDLAGQLQVFHL